MKLAPGNRRSWRALLTAGLFATPFLSCGPAEQVAPLALEGGQEAVGTQEQGAISWTLGAQYDATKTNINFNVYSSRATRIELYIYKTAQGAQEVVKYVMTKNATTNVWSKSVAVSTLQTTYGITGPVYYGYRAWGPELDVQLELDQGLQPGLHLGRRRQRQPLQPEQAAGGPVRAGNQPRPDQRRPTRTAPSTPPAPPTGSRTAAPRRPRASSWRRTPPATAPSPRAPSRTTSSTRCTCAASPRATRASPPPTGAPTRARALKAASLAALGVTAVEFLPRAGDGQRRQRRRPPPPPRTTTTGAT